MSVLQHRYPNLHITYARSLRRAMTNIVREIWTPRLDSRGPDF